MRLDVVVVTMLVVISVISGVLVYMSETLWQLIVLAILTATLLAVTRIIDKHLDAREACGLYAMTLLALLVGTIVGAIASRTLYAALLATSISLAILVYLVVTVKVRVL